MCINSLPYCPPVPSTKIAVLLYSAAAEADANEVSSSSSPTTPSSAATALPRIPTTTDNPLGPANTSTESEWFICNHPCPTNPHQASSSPYTCPNIEIRHPGFNGARCSLCSAQARHFAKRINNDDKQKTAAKDKLREEIERLECVVGNMKRKLWSLGGKTVREERRERDERERVEREKAEREKEGGLREVLEQGLGGGWGSVL